MRVGDYPPPHLGDLEKGGGGAGKSGRAPEGGYSTYPEFPQRWRTGARLVAEGRGGGGGCSRGWAGDGPWRLDSRWGDGGGDWEERKRGREEKALASIFPLVYWIGRVAGFAGFIYI